MYRIRSISVDPKHWSMHWKLQSWSALKRRDVSMTTTKCGRRRLHKTMMQANEMRMRWDKTQRRENLAFINITHSFIIYYCVLLSVRSDTFLNTLGNQRSLRAARVHPAHTRREKRLQCVECEKRRKRNAENFNQRRPVQHFWINKMRNWIEIILLSLPSFLLARDYAFLFLSIKETSDITNQRRY